MSRRALQKRLAANQHLERLLASTRTNHDEGHDFIRKLIVAGQYTRERACDGKARFHKVEHVQKAKDDLEARHGDKGHLTFYPCPFCGGWHLATAQDAP